VVRAFLSIPYLTLSATNSLKTQIYVAVPLKGTAISNSTRSLKKKIGSAREKRL